MIDIQLNYCLKIYYHEGHPQNKKLYVRAIVDNDYIVCRHWIKRIKDKLGKWKYEVFPRDLLDGLYNSGNLKINKR